MRRVVAGRRCIHVLSVEFQTVEAPFFDGLRDEPRSVLADIRVGRTEIIGVPVRDLVFRAADIV